MFAPGFHSLIISYDSGVFRLYVDGLEHLYAVALTPEVTFLHSLLGTPWWSLRLNTPSTVIYTLFYYGLLFTPAGLLWALVTARDSGNAGLSRRWVWAGILLPSVALEGVLATMRGIEPQNSLLGVGIATGAMLLFRVPAARFFQDD